MNSINLLHTPKVKTESKIKTALTAIISHTLLIVRPLLRGLLIGLILFYSCAAVSLYTARFIYKAINPNISEITNKPLPQSTKIFSRDGELLYEIHNGGKRTNVKLTQISKNLQNATIAIEDKDFYNHHGIELHSMIRAIAINYVNHATLQGGSTITQQVIKNLVLTPQKTALRKITEAVWAFELERRLSKDQILELYLNSIPYGRNAIGIEAAAKVYFGKSAKDLTVAESAYLAALPQAPSYYNPGGPHQSDLEDRKNRILKLMLDQGYINELAYRTAQNEQVSFVPIDPPFKAQHFIAWVQDDLNEQYGDELLKIGGLNVYTTLDMKLQTLAEETIKEITADYPQKFHASNAALVAIDPKTGEVLAMVGSKNFFGKSEPAGCTPGKNCLFEPQTNAAISLLQPGSSFKPYVYATAFNQKFGYSPSSITEDISKNFGTGPGDIYIPQNYNLHQYGKVTMRKALAGSLNIATVYTASLLGVGEITDTARHLGITAPLKNCGLAIALGSCEISLVEHVAAFGGLANLGVHNSATGIHAIYKNDGSTVATHEPNQVADINPQSAYEVLSILTDNNAREYIFGKDTPLVFSDRQVAAKTGTTQNWKDAWTVGATPSLAVGVWVGNNDGSLMKPQSDGIYVAAPLWRAFMDKALAGSPAETFQVPEGVETLPYNTKTGRPLPKTVQNSPTDVFASFAKARANQTVAGASTQNDDKKKSQNELDPNLYTIEPFVTQVINQVPDKIQVANVNQKNVDSLELFIDGVSVQVLTKKPYIFNIPEYLQNDPHTILIYPHQKTPQDPTPTPRIGLPNKN